MQFHKNKIRISFVLMLLLILPIFLGAIYMVQKSSSQANASCPALNIKVQRTSNSTARIAFDTSCSVKAKVNCAIARGGIKFFCAEDSLATQNHILTPEEVTLILAITFLLIRAQVPLYLVTFLPAQLTARMD